MISLIFGAFCFLLVWKWQLASSRRRAIRYVRADPALEAAFTKAVSDAPPVERWQIEHLPASDPQHQKLYLAMVRRLDRDGVITPAQVGRALRAHRMAQGR